MTTPAMAVACIFAAMHRQGCPQTIYGSSACMSGMKAVTNVIGVGTADFTDMIDELDSPDGLLQDENENQCVRDIV